MNDAVQHQENELTYLQRAELARLAATILRRRAQLLEVGGHDQVVDDILTLATQTGASHRQAAGVFLDELDGLIAEARRLDRLEREEHRQRVERHGPQAGKLLREAGDARRSIERLTEKLQNCESRYDVRVERLRQAGLTGAQITAVIGEVKTPDQEKVEIRQKIAVEQERLTTAERELAALSGALARGRDHNPAAAA